MKPTLVMMINVCKPFIKHIWYGAVFNSKHEYKRLVKEDFINIQNFSIFLRDLFYVYFLMMNFPNLTLS